MAHASTNLSKHQGFRAENGNPKAFQTCTMHLIGKWPNIVHLATTLKATLVIHVILIGAAHKDSSAR